MQVTNYSSACHKSRHWDASKSAKKIGWETNHLISIYHNRFYGMIKVSRQNCTIYHLSVLVIYLSSQLYIYSQRVSETAMCQVKKTSTW